MKLVAVALSILGMLLSSTSAMAEGPVPFSALMQTAGAQPDVPPMTDAAGKATPLSTPQAAPPHMTSGGKVMVGAGIGMVAIGRHDDRAHARLGFSVQTNRTLCWRRWNGRGRSDPDRFWEAPA